MTSQSGFSFETLPPGRFYGSPLYSRCRYESPAPSVPSTPSAAQHWAKIAVNSAPSEATPAPALIRGPDSSFGQGQGWNEGFELRFDPEHGYGGLSEQAGVGVCEGALSAIESAGLSQPCTPSHLPSHSDESTGTQMTAPACTQKKPSQQKEVFSANELFFLLTNANHLNIYGTPRKDSTRMWEQLLAAHNASYSRPMNSMRRKLEELVHYHIDPDSKKVSKAMRDLFMTESNQVRFGAPLDVLKTAWLGRKKSDEDKIKDQKKKDEDRVGGAILREAARTTWKRQLTASSSTDDAEADTAEVGNSSFNHADDEASAQSDKDEEKENNSIAPPISAMARKRKSQHMDLAHCDSEAEFSTTKKKKTKKVNRTNTPHFDWGKHFEEERETRLKFESGLMSKLEEGNKYNQEAISFMKSAHDDNCSFQNRFLDLLSRKL